jgi:hypothetical protein
MRALAIAALAFFATPAMADAPVEMKAAAEAFYAAYATFHPSDGIPDASGRAKYWPLITPALEKLLVDADGAEASFAKANKGSPPLIEGDLFTSNFEGATSSEVGACKGDAKAGQCSVALVYDDGKDKPVMWSDTVYLVATPAGWRVDDIAFGATWEFGNKGRLTKALKDTIENAGY